MLNSNSELHTRVMNHISQIYPADNVEQLSQQLINAMGLDQQYNEPEQHKNHWD